MPCFCFRVLEIQSHGTWSGEARWCSAVYQPGPSHTSKGFFVHPVDKMQEPGSSQTAWHGSTQGYYGPASLFSSFLNASTECKDGQYEHWTPTVYCSRNKGLVRVPIPHWNYPAARGRDRGLESFRLGRDNRIERS